jgi:hypothetical protein
LALNTNQSISQSINQSIDLHKYLMPVPLHLLMMCHVLVPHRKHYNVSSMFAVNIHASGVSALMQNKSYILQFSLNPTEKNLIYNLHIGEDRIPSSDNCCHLDIEMNSRFRATERTTNACRKGRNAFFPINGINEKTIRVSQII